MEDISRVMLNSIMRSLLGRVGEGHTPLSQEELTALPRRDITDDETPISCSICMEPCSSGQTVVDLECTHTYHEQCITHWFSRHNTCPMCRRVYGAGASNQGAYHASESAENASSAVAAGTNVQISVLPMDVDIRFVYNTESITTRWNTHTTTIVDIFNFLKHIVAFTDAPDLLLVNMRNVRQSFRTSQSYQSLQYTLYEVGITHPTTLNVFAV